MENDLKIKQLQSRFEKSNYLHFEPEFSETEYLIADVIGCQRDFHNHHLVINRGTKYGLKMTLLLAGSEISLGDSIVTSYLSTIFPAEHFVGIVSKIQEAGDDFHMKVKIKSAIIPESLDKVAVLFYKKDLNYETEINN